MEKKQNIFTPPLNRILDCLFEAHNRGEQILSVSPHFLDNGTEAQGYIVITTPQRK